MKLQAVILGLVVVAAAIIVGFKFVSFMLQDMTNTPTQSYQDFLAELEELEASL